MFELLLKARELHHALISLLTNTTTIQTCDALVRTLEHTNPSHIGIAYLGTPDPQESIGELSVFRCFSFTPCEAVRVLGLPQASLP